MVHKGGGGQVPFRPPYALQSQKVQDNSGVKNDIKLERTC